MSEQDEEAAATAGADLPRTPAPELPAQRYALTLLERVDRTVHDAPPAQL